MMSSADGTVPLPGIVTAEDTAAEAIANLANGPTWFVGDEVRQQTSAFYAISRSDAVRLAIEYGGGAMAQIGQDGATS